MTTKKTASKTSPDEISTPAYGPDVRYDQKRRKVLAEEALSGREMGREEGVSRQNRAATRGGVLGTPAAYVERAGQYIGDKFDDADAYLSEKLGMDTRANFKRGVRQGLKDEGYKNGGKVKKMASGGMTSSASKRADGIAQRGKTKGKVC